MKNYFIVVLIIMLLNNSAELSVMPVMLIGMIVHDFKAKTLIIVVQIRRSIF